MPKFYLNLGYKLKKKALCYSHLNNTVDILDRNIVMDYFRHVWGIERSVFFNGREK